MNNTTAPAFTNLTDLAAEKLGGKVPLCSDDFFAEKENLINPGRGIFIADKYTDRGKWMDGWESRRKRTPGHDWCIIQLATSGKIHGVDIDTNHFLGNHPPYASVEAANISSAENVDPIAIGFDKAEWKEILPKSPLQPGFQNFYEINDHNIYTHIKLHIYPDGGVARLKVYGEVFKDWSTVDASEIVNLASATNGAKSVLCNDMFFSHMDNLIMPGRGVNMGDGWETKRNRTPNNRDWVIVRLAHKGSIEKILVDTCHFKGNYPDSCSIEGCDISYKDENKLDSNAIDPMAIGWKIILPQSKLSADHEHFFEDEIKNKGPFTHVRLNIFPDGGVSRLRLWGRLSREL
jgi:allantoicase